jgi:uncharacterized protein YndB with AHSA1/START domain
MWHSEIRTTNHETSGAALTFPGALRDRPSSDRAAPRHGLHKARSSFHDFPGAFPVEIVDVEKNRRIVLRWAANEGAPSDGDAAVTASAGYSTTVTMSFEPLEDGRTLVSIAEEGWRSTANGLKASYGNCQGWSQMLCALKAYLEHGINLRDDMYK